MSKLEGLERRYDEALRALKAGNRPQLAEALDIAVSALTALRESEALKDAAYDDSERAIVRAEKLALDLKCLEESTVDAGAFNQLKEENARLRAAIEGAPCPDKDTQCIAYGWSENLCDCWKRQALAQEEALK